MISALTEWEGEAQKHKKHHKKLNEQHEQYDLHHATSFSSIRMLWLYYLHEVINNIDLKEYGDFYGFHLDFDDSEIHRKYNIFRGNDTQKVQKWKECENMNQWFQNMSRSDADLPYGLFFEMMRYLFGVFPEIYDFHFNMISDPENELKMEVWMTDFDRNVNVLLDRLNLIDIPKNRKRLKHHLMFDVNIAAERKRLYRMLKSQDSSRTNPSNGTRREMLIDSKHIHKERDNAVYIDALLGLDPQICLLLKHITNLIDYGWSYSEYC